jgi:predicted P-loop ATPase
VTQEGRTILADYTRAGWALVPIPHGSKGPRTANWNSREMCIADPAIAEWIEGNVGLAHAYSGTCAIDIDDMAKATVWLAERKIDLHALLNAPDAVRIESRPGRAKLLYRLPKPLPSFNLGGLELRCAASNGRTVQDVLPPSVHPETREPYAWAGADWRKLPPLPGDLESLWRSLIPATRPKPAHPNKANDTTRKDSPRLRAMLERHSPDASYPDWVAVGMSLHHETQGSDAGLALWNEWSAKGAKYKGIGDLETHWRSFRMDHVQPRTLASLRTESAAEAHDFPDLSLTPVTERTVPAGLTGPMRAQPDTHARDLALESARSVRRTKAGTIEARVSNVVAVLGVEEVSRYEIARDTFQDAIMVTPKHSTAWRPLTETDYTTMRVTLETSGNCEPIPAAMMRDAVKLVAERNKMDTAQIWLGSLQWDGIERIERFCHTHFGTRDEPYTRAVGVYLWTALAGRVMAPGCQADMVPVLIGKQGVGKSRGVQALVPSPEHYVELRLDEPDDAIARKCRAVLVAELAEMRGLRAADIERVKSFITRTQERWVPKYEEFATNYARRFLIIGTTNDEEFLPTDLENRRWLPMHVKRVNVNAIRDDREQLWAEALIRYTVEGIYWEGMDQLAVDARAAASGEDAWEDAIVLWLKEGTPTLLKMQDILSNAVGLDSRTVKRSDELRVARILRGLGYERQTKWFEGRTQKVWALEKAL